MKVSAPVGIVAAATASAGLIHAAAAGSHAADREMAFVFAATAVAQLACAAAVVLVPRRLVLVAPALLNAGALAAWTASRTVGIDLIDGLEKQSAGVQDSVCAALELVAVAAAIVAIGAPRLPAIRATWAAAFGSVALLAAVPAMAIPHEHEHGHDAASLTVGTHAPDGTTELAASDHLHGIDLPEVDGITRAQEERAAKLIADTRKGLERFSDVAAAQAAGFFSIGDAGTGWEHYVNRDYLANATVLDPNEPESLVFKVEPGGVKTLASAMYILSPGKTMADVPEIAGELTTWHDHQNLCWDATGTRLAGILVNGVCRPGGTFRATPPMLHVWLTEHPCGPFAGIEGSSHTGACHAH